jgi:hypothetical protein
MTSLRASTSASRSARWLLSTALCLGACGAATPVLTIVGRPLERVEASATLGASSVGTGTLVRLFVTDPGPPNVSDAGVTFELDLDLGAGVSGGTTLPVAGTATLDGNDATGGPFTTVFTPEASNGALVRSASLVSRCFCGSATTHFVQSISGHVDVVEVSGFAMALEVDLIVDGQIPGSNVSEQIHLSGHFDAHTPTR